MDELPPRRIWLPSGQFMIAVGLILIVSAVIVTPGLLSSNRASNERNASTSLKTLTSAEADFRANDRDQNLVEDFWTGDVSGLYYVKPSTGGPEIRLIEESVANADLQSLFELKPGTCPKGGYFLKALERDESLKGDLGLYKRDTDKSGRKVHNLERFGFCAFPKSGKDGKYIFLVNENNTIFREATDKPRDSFPDDSTLKSIGTTTN